MPGFAKNMIKLRKLQIEALLPMLLAFSGIVTLIPLMVFRLLASDWFLATVDMMVLSVECAVIYAIYKHGAIRPASILLAIVCAGGAVASAYLKGGVTIFWVYPVIVAMFFLLRPAESISAACLIALAVYPVVVDHFTSIESASLFASFIVTGIVSSAFSVLTKAQRSQLTELTLRDPLTGAENRRAMDEEMQVVIAAARDSDIPASLIMLDIDYFKRINDDYGHAAGDKVLSAVAKNVRATIRAEDRLFRVGGEEFVVLSKGLAVDLARRVGETLRESVANLRIPRHSSSERLSVTVSLGVAELLLGETADHWYKRADDALYEAKRSGRNRTFLADKTVSLSGTDSFVTNTSISKPI